MGHECRATSNRNGGRDHPGIPGDFRRNQQGMKGFIEKTLAQRRSMETALADLLAEYQRKPRPELARTIELLRTEIEFRKPPVEPS